MTTTFDRPPRMRMWVAGASLCLLATAGVSAFVRAIPSSNAGMPGEAAASPDGAAPGVGDVADVGARSARPAAAKYGYSRPARASCPECGVVKSMRQIEIADDGAGQDVAPAAIAGRDTAGTIAAAARTGRRYEFTVRFRDGSTTVLSDSGPGTWRVGDRVIVIRRPIAPDG